MRTAVVYESWFGNTKAVAGEVAEALRAEGDVTLHSVDDPPPPLADVDLIVVGAPTHVHGLSGATSRKSALEKLGRPDEPTERRGVRDWLELLPDVDGVRAAAFDTRADKPALLVGSAARGIAKRLRLRGFELVSPPESFFIVDVDGPLVDGELERARAWARRIAGAAVPEPLHG